MSNIEVSVTRGVRLFTKNTGHRRSETMSMMADVCSLPVPERPFQSNMRYSQLRKRERRAGKERG